MCFEPDVELSRDVLVVGSGLFGATVRYNYDNNYFNMDKTVESSMSLCEEIL